MYQCILHHVLMYFIILKLSHMEDTKSKNLTFLFKQNKL